LHHSQIVSSILGVSQLFIFKQRSLAFVAATIAISTVQANASQAAIVGGRVTGTWTNNFTQTGGLNIGDMFTANYTYDDSQVVTTSRTPYGIPEFESQTNLLSLEVVSGGNIFHNFDFTSAIGTISSSTYHPYSGALYEYRRILAYNPSITKPAYTFDLNTSLSPVSYYGTRSLSENARAYFVVPNSPGLQRGAFLSSFAGGVASSAYGVESSNIKFSGAFLPTPTSATVPTPALLPGLIGMGIGLLRKRR
jgi:hypothetical protein